MGLVFLSLHPDKIEGETLTVGLSIKTKINVGTKSGKPQINPTKHP
jgi:hypothetical protein